MKLKYRYPSANAFFVADKKPRYVKFATRNRLSQGIPISITPKKNKKVMSRTYVDLCRVGIYRITGYRRNTYMKLK